MEAVEESPLQNVTAEAVKANLSTFEETTGVENSVETNVCHKPNGVSDSQDTEHVQLSLDGTEVPIEEQSSIVEEEIITETVISDQELVPTEKIAEETITTIEEVPKEVPIIEEQHLEGIIIKSDHNEDIQTEQVEVDGIVESIAENVRFETEILIETNIDDQSSKYKIIYDDSEQPDHTNNILNDLGQNIELSEVLCSSDVSENLENNNCDVTQEVFNKEELLDILEGNDMEESRKVITENFAADCKSLETQLALQQLSRLKKIRTSNVRSTLKKVEKKTRKKNDSPKEESVRKRSSRQKDDSSQANISAASEDKEESLRRKSSKQKDENKPSNSDTVPESSEENVKKKSGKQKGDDSQSNTDENVKKKSGKQKDDGSQSNTDSTPELKEESAKKKGEKQKEDILQTSSAPTAEPKEVSIVNALVKDWDDDETAEGDQGKKVVEDSNKLLGKPEEPVKSQETVVVDNKIDNSEASAGDGQAPSLNKSESETLPQRRLGRVIKKKVIFDPDNPDTFTKSKSAKKENQSEKDQTDQPTPKKVKTEQISPRPKSKSPIQTKLQWKKPQPKSVKQNKRLTEIDRLLMDEGAVNMICQLTPEAPQGNKNMRSKAEFIKKIQSSTPEGKEMKFRERIKKECKFDDGDAKKISSKDRLSLSFSAKSPSASEDFEAHSADDSIIYRRHSSSSYSSPCMSPRRLSDVDNINQNASTAPLGVVRNQTQEEVGVLPESDAFMAETTGTPTTTVINKTDFLSIKEKLNSKLSQALNKRKRENTKPDKPIKMKKVSKPEKLPVAAEYKYVKLSIAQKLAEICILNAGIIFNIEVINELKSVLEKVCSRNDISVTLLKAESGTLCSGLELSPIVQVDQEKGVNYALEMAESVRSLLSTLEIHGKLVCTVVEDRCYGLGLSLVALSDVTVASENATFELTTFKGAPLMPGASVLTTRGLSQSLLNELIVMERPVSAAEAARGGLVSRVVWPARVQEQARAIALDIAAQPHENIMLKKQMLNLKRGASEAFVTGLQIERDLFVNYWVSEEGRELVRASLEVPKE